MDPDNVAPPRFGMEILDAMTPEELSEYDQGRFLCPDCGRYYTPDGEAGHFGCPTPRTPEA